MACCTIPISFYDFHGTLTNDFLRVQLPTTNLLLALQTLIRQIAHRFEFQNKQKRTSLIWQFPLVES